MGKVKIITKDEESIEDLNAQISSQPKPSGRAPKKKIVAGTLHVEATFNNTKVILSEKKVMLYFGHQLAHLVLRGLKRELLLLLGKQELLLVKKLKL